MKSYLLISSLLASLFSAGVALAGMQGNQTPEGDRGVQGLTLPDVRDSAASQPERQHLAQTAASPVAPAEKPNGVRSFPSRPSAAGLVSPARGQLAIAYQEVEPDHGTPSKGISIKTRDYAQVVAPYDGKVKYAGEFMTLGQILIIEHGEKYYSLLAGFEEITAIAGQWLLAGEPVGKMGAGGNEEALLYFELRRTGEPIDPLPWLAMAELDTQEYRSRDPITLPDGFATQILQLAGDYEKLSKDLLAIATRRDELTARLIKLTAKQSALVADLAKDNQNRSLHSDTSTSE